MRKMAQLLFAGGMLFKAGWRKPVKQRNRPWRRKFATWQVSTSENPNRRRTDRNGHFSPPGRPGGVAACTVMEGPERGRTRRPADPTCGLTSYLFGGPNGSAENLTSRVGRCAR